MDLLYIILAAIGLVVCYFTGSIIEGNHYNSIKRRELMLYKSACITFGKSMNSNKVTDAFMVSGSAVYGCDHFKAFLASLRAIFGGNVSSYESVLDRARREAILRMRESAAQRKATAVINVKIDTVLLDPPNTKRNNPKVCVVAYGTAIKYAK